MSKLFDSHTHIHFPVYDADREEVIRRAREAGVKMLCVGTQAASSEAAVELARKYPGEVWAAAGFHPNHFARAWYHDKKEQADGEREQFDAKKLLEIAKQPEVVAIGECGLDYYRLTNAEEEKKAQKDAFVAQIRIAEQVGKPLMMHIRPSQGTDDAYLDALDILKAEKFSGGKISHFFVGSLDATKKMLEAGFCFTFGGVITFARDYDEVIKFLPIENILLETDAPYVAPAPHRGKRNEPAYISATAAKIAELKGLSAEEVAEKTFANALRIFKINL